MTISSSSTYAEVAAAYEDNCDYDLVNSSAKCRAFIQACRILQRRNAEETQTGGNERVRDDYKKIQAELDRALEWLAANDTASGGAAAAGQTTVSFLNLSQMGQ